MALREKGGKMTGKRENNDRCPICGGALQHARATIPYVLANNLVVVVKSVPARRCLECDEPFTTGQVTDQIVVMLQQLKQLNSEVSVVSFTGSDVSFLPSQRELQPA